MKNIAIAAVAGLLSVSTAFGVAQAEQKISSDLQAVLSRLQEHPNSSPDGAVARWDAARRVQVYVRCAGPFGGDEIGALENAGFEFEREFDGIAQGRISPERIGAVSQLPFVRQISLPSYAVTRAGAAMTQGDAILRSDLVRSLGFDGKGIKVGVISDGIGGLGEAQVSGDLGDVQSVGFSGSGSEGTAMLEIVHDIAPGAQLGFCGPATSLDFIECVNELAQNFQADVIVDDLGFYNEPVFEDGPAARAVAEAIENFGVLYVSAAGNDAQKHYQASFHGANLLSLKGVEHDFGTAGGGLSDATLNVIVPPHTTMAAVLQWNDPFGASANNYDLYVVSEDEKTALASSKNVQDGNDDPLEVVYVRNDGDSPGRAKLAVTKVSGQDRKISLFCPGAERFEEYSVPGGSVFGHAGLPGVLAVGAVSSFDTGLDTIQPFSSQGPASVEFPAADTRFKPDLVATDTVSVSGAGGFPSVFSGTSAAAPHVAAIAALIKPRFAFAPELRARLKEYAADRGEPGIDSVFGAGLVDAFAASGLVMPIDDFPGDPVGGSGKPAPENVDVSPHEIPGDEPSAPPEIPQDTPGEEGVAQDARGASGGCALIPEDEAPQSVILGIWKRIAAASPEQRSALIEPLLRESYDFEAFYRRALQDHWDSWDETERKTFSQKFESVFLKSLSDHIRSLPASGGSLVLRDSHVEGDFAQAHFLGSKGGKSAVLGVFLDRKDGRWKICDVEVEGVLISRNYRAQFNRILRNEEFGGLMARLDRKNQERNGVP